MSRQKGAARNVVEDLSKISFKSVANVPLQKLSEEIST